MTANNLFNGLDEYQINKLVESFETLVLSESEYERRVIFLNKIISDHSSLSENLQKYFASDITRTYLKLLWIIAHLRQITESMLIDYIEGIVELYFFIVYKKRDSIETCEVKMRPAFEKFSELIKSELWIKFLISLEVTGQEFQNVNGVTIPFSIEAILLHIDRIKATPLDRRDIAAIKASFQEYNEKLYGGNKLDNSEIPKRSEEFTFDEDLIYTLYKTSLNSYVLNCTIIDFFSAVKYADFKKIECDTKQRTQYLIYRISKKMSKAWFESAAKSKNWSRKDCSHHGKLHEENTWAGKIYKLTS